MCGPRRLPLTGRISVRSVSVRYRACVCTLSANVLLCAAHRPLHERRRKCCLAQRAAGIGIARRETRGVARSRRPAVMRTYKGCLPPKGAALTMPTNATTTRKSSTCTISNISTSSVGVPKICAPQCAGTFIQASQGGLPRGKICRQIQQSLSQRTFLDTTWGIPVLTDMKTSKAMKPSTVSSCELRLEAGSDECKCCISKIKALHLEQNVNDRLGEFRYIL